MRIVAGLVLLYLCIDNVVVKSLLPAVQRYGVGSWPVPTNPIMWLGVALCFVGLNHVVNLSFSRSWGLWPQVVVGLLAVAAVTFDLWKYGSLWGPPLGLLVLLLLAYIFGHAGLSFLVAGGSATPG